MAPTNILRAANKRPIRQRQERRHRSARREILIRAGSVSIRARLLDTPTADCVWRTLPIYTTAETWGACVHFETPVETGLEPGARARVSPGEVAFRPDEDRVLVAFGATPISAAGEVRLPCPCNIWAMALDDVAALAAVRPGERVAVLEADS